MKTLCTWCDAGITWHDDDVYCDKEAIHFFRFHNSDTFMYVLRCDEHMKLTYMSPETMIDESIYVAALVMDH